MAALSGSPEDSYGQSAAHLINTSASAIPARLFPDQFVANDPAEFVPRAEGDFRYRTVVGIKRPMWAPAGGRGRVLRCWIHSSQEGEPRVGGIENPPGKGLAGALSTRPYRCPRRVPGNASAENVVTTAQQPMDVDSGVTAMISVPPVGRS